MADIKLTPVNLTAKLSNEGELAGKIDNALIYGGYTEEEVDELLAGKADIDHNHDSAYADKSTTAQNFTVMSNHVTRLDNEDKEIRRILTQKASLNHKHDEYLTEHQSLDHLATKEELKGKADINHNHDSAYVNIMAHSILTTQVNKHSGQISTLETELKNHTHDEYATESFVIDKIAEAELSGGGSGGTIDLSGYVTEEELEEKKYVNESFVIEKIGEIELLEGPKGEKGEDGYTPIKGVDYFDGEPGPQGPKGEPGNSVELIISNEAPSDINDLWVVESESADYATKEYVDEAISNIPNSGTDLSNYALKDHTHDQYLTEHQSLDHLALKEHTHSEYLTEHQSLGHLALKEHTHSEYLTEHQDISHLALKTDIPSLDGYALKSELPSIEGLASQEYVDNANSEIQTQIDDLKSSVSNGKSLLASAITDMGVETLATDSWETMAANIRMIQNGGGENPEEPDNPENSYYVEYTVIPTRDGDKLNSRDGYAFYKYLPRSNYTTGVFKYDKITITLKDGTTTEDLNTLVENIEKVRIDYPEETEGINFGTSASGTSEHGLQRIEYINTNNFTSYFQMFYNCENLQYVNATNWNTVNKDGENMFKYVPETCEVLVSDELWTLTEEETAFSGTFTRI